MTDRTKNAGTERDATSPRGTLRSDLLTWYDRERRPLPWRERPSAYGIWVSEIMLQQTTVATVMTRWRSFVARFPDQAALAAAPLEDVLAAWSGLGYYRRARALHEAAREVMRAGGELPRDAAGWRALPGVGPYTAGAVASMACGQRAAAVDTNVSRVLRRLHCRDAAAADALTAAALERLADELVDPDRPGDWNQALMDLGAAVCTPRRRTAAPARSRAVAGRDAAATRRRWPADAPVPRPRRSSCRSWWSAAAGAWSPCLPGRRTGIRCRGLGAPVRVGFAGLYDGLLGPAVDLLVPDPAGRSPRGLRRRLAGGPGGRGGAPRSIGGLFRHAITRYRLRVEVFESTARSGTDPCRRAGSAAARRRLAAVPWSSLAHKALRRAGVPIEI